MGARRNAGLMSLARYALGALALSGAAVFLSAPVAAADSATADSVPTAADSVGRTDSSTKAAASRASAPSGPIRAAGHRRVSPPAPAPAPAARAVIPRLFGNGTADSPNGGIVAGNGFSYDAESCPGVNACSGGHGGLLAGSGGNGWNGGDGGAAGWVGNGGDGGSAVPGGAGGAGGTGGLFLGHGGTGGSGGAAITPGYPGGAGGPGGDAGLLSLWGRGGNGGTGGPSAAGGAGGDGSWVFGVGGDGGATGTGGVPGGGGEGRLLFVIPRNGADGLDNSLVYFLDDTSQTINTPQGYGVIGEFSAADRAALTGDGRVVGESVALINNDGTDGYSLWPLISDLFTSATPIAEGDKIPLATKILSQVMVYPGLGPGEEFPSPAEGTPTDKGGYVIWAQDFEFAPGHTSTDGAYAGVLAVMWAGKQILGDSMKILPVPSSSLFKTLGSPTEGAYNSDHIINGDGATPYLASLGLTGLPTNPAAGTGGEWNFLSLAYANGLIDGFIGQQYNPASTGTVTPDTLAFYSADLPYALMSAYDGQVDTGGPWDSDYYGTIPFHAGVYWDGTVDSSWGQPASTNQKLIPTPVPLPTS
ncbi:MAG: hypothetical protein QG597_4446 [Actinomycetota bacterium]|nr:hypothetical protein [Actinomycetota bacterium]